MQNDTLRGTTGMVQVVLLFEDEGHREDWLVEEGLLDGDAAHAEYMQRRHNGVLSYRVGLVTRTRDPVENWRFDARGRPLSSSTK